MQDSVPSTDQRVASSSSVPARYKNMPETDSTMNEITQPLLPQPSPATQHVRTVTVLQTADGGSEFVRQHGTFFAQVMFSLLGAVFACAMLWKGEDAGMYLPVLTGIIGYWVPSPKSSASKDPVAPQQYDAAAAAAEALPV